VAETFLALRDIKVDYGRGIVLDLPSLDVHRGEVLALIGPNGAGKSTVLRTIGLLLTPTSGKVLFCNQMSSPGNALDFRRRIASVFQEPLLLRGSVYDNVVLGLKLRGVNTREFAMRVRPWLERLGIQHLAERQVGTLSGGEARRTSLTRALVLAPEVLLLDEPFSALDEPTREGLLDDLQRVLKMIKTTTVLVTHDRDEAFRLADRIGILSEGRIIQLGPTAEVFYQPNSERAADIVGFENRIPGVVESTAEGNTVVRFVGGIAVARGVYRPGTRVVMCIRAEDVGLICRGAATGASRDLNQIRGRIANVSRGTLQCRIAVNNGKFSLKAAVPRSQFHDLDVYEGVPVMASFESSAVHLVKDEEESRTGR